MRKAAGKEPERKQKRRKLKRIRLCINRILRRMKKTKEQLQAELIVADLIKELNPQMALNKARQMRTDREYAIAQRVTLAIILAILWDIYEDFNQEMMKQVYDIWLDYHEQYVQGKGNIYQQMVAVDELLEGKLLNEKLFEIVKTKAEEEE